jgi:hypothetical protein
MLDSGGMAGSTLKRPTKPSVGASLGKAAASASKKVVKKSSSSSSRSSSSSSRSSGSSGGSSGSSGGSSGGGGFGSAGAGLKIPSLAAYLGGDAAYQGILSGGKRSLADFLSDLGRRRGEATTQFNQTSASMERDRVQQLEDLRNEFASRGLIQSGLYGQEQGRFQQQFTDQSNALKQQQASLMADLMSQQTNYQREQGLSLQAAKQEALARRAAKYNITG